MQGRIVSIAVKKQKDGDKFIEAKVRLKHSKSTLSSLGEIIEQEAEFTIDPVQTELPLKGKKTGTDD